LESVSQSVFAEVMYWRCNVIGRCMGWPKEALRAGSRHEKLAANDLAMVDRAMVLRCMDILEAPDRTLDPTGAPRTRMRRLMGAWSCLDCVAGQDEPL
jgi:hypothetical protein